MMNTNLSFRTGTASGTLLSIVPNIVSDDIVKTIILAIIGASTSFVITVFLQWLSARNKND